MAIVAEGEITITKGFDTWKAMVRRNHKRMAEMGMVMLFAGVQKDDPTKLHAIMKFPDLEALRAFSANEELTEERLAAVTDFPRLIELLSAVSRYNVDHLSVSLEEVM